MDPTSEDAFEKPADMLRDLPWLSLVDDAVFQKVMAGFECRLFEEGVTLLKENDPDNGMFVIVEGRVRIEIILKMNTIDIVSADDVHDHVIGMILCPLQARVHPPESLFKLDNQVRSLFNNGSFCHFPANSMVCPVWIQPGMQLNPSFVCFLDPEIQGIIIRIGCLTLFSCQIQGPGLK